MLQIHKLIQQQRSAKFIFRRALQLQIWGRPESPGGDDVPRHESPYPERQNNSEKCRITGKLRNISYVKPALILQQLSLEAEGAAR
jgi:hypothetical protein